MLGPRDYVLDADDLGAVPKLEQYDTLLVRTRRGMHAHFTLPGGTRLRQGSRVGSGIDGKGFAWATGTRTVALWAGLDGREVHRDAARLELPASWIAHIGPPRTSAPDDLTPAMHAVLEHHKHAMPALGYTRAAQQALDQIARSLAAELGADSWGHDFYRAAAWFGQEYVAAGECTLQTAENALTAIFHMLDTWKKDPAYVLTSISNGLRRGTVEALLAADV